MSNRFNGFLIAWVRHRPLQFDDSLWAYRADPLAGILQLCLKCFVTARKTLTMNLEPNDDLVNSEIIREISKKSTRAVTKDFPNFIIKAIFLSRAIHADKVMKSFSRKQKILHFTYGRDERWNHF